MNSRNIFHFAIGPIGASIFGFIALPLMTWFFPAEDIGRLTMFQVAISFSLLLFSLGLDQAYVREYHEVDNKTALLKTALLPGTVVLGFTVFMIAILPVSISELLFEKESWIITLILFLTLFVAFFSRFLGLILRMQERGLAYSMSQVLPRALFLILIGVYILFSFKPTFHNLMIAHAVSLLIVMISNGWNTRGEWMAAIFSTIDCVKLKQMLNYGFPLIAGGMAFWGLISIDKFFLRTMSSFEELGIYSIALSFAGVALIFQSIFSTVWAPTVYKWSAKGDIDPEKIKILIDQMLVAVVVIWSLAGMLSWCIMYILPPEYARVQYLLIASMAFPLLYALSEATGIGIGIKRKTMYALVASVTALIINIVGNYFLIPIYGAEGAASSSAIAFVSFLLIRTELSIYLWQSMPRFKIYFFVFSALILSLLGMMGSDMTDFLITALWGILLVLVIVMHWKVIILSLRNSCHSMHKDAI